MERMTRILENPTQLFKFETSNPYKNTRIEKTAENINGFQNQKKMMKINQSKFLYQSFLLFSKEQKIKKSK